MQSDQALSPNIDQAMWTAFSKAGDQRPTLCLFLCDSSLLLTKTEQHGVKLRYSCEMAIDIEVNG